LNDFAEYNTYNEFDSYQAKKTELLEEIGAIPTFLTFGQEKLCENRSN
jgi:hypothetical protein